ncbi:unnamed protein product [Musa acuminata subsp. burmannicoides]
MDEESTSKFVDQTSSCYTSQLETTTFGTLSRRQKETIQDHNEKKKSENRRLPRPALGVNKTRIVRSRLGLRSGPDLVEEVAEEAEEDEEEEVIHRHEEGGGAVPPVDALSSLTPLLSFALHPPPLPVLSLPSFLFCLRFA